MTQLYIFGAGGHGHDIIAMIPYYEESDNNLHFMGFFDDKVCNPTEVAGTFTKNLKNKQAWRICVIGLNWPQDRFELLQKLEGWEFPNIIHNSVDALVPSLGVGVVVGQNTSLGFKSKIGNHVHIGNGQK